MFDSIFRTGSHGGTGECHCGVLHYDTANGWDDDHLDNMLPEAEKGALENPELYQFQDNAIEYFDFNGRLYVYGCRCGMDDFIFNFLVEEKQQVLRFYLESQDRLNVSDIS